jgi:hypothetical protein
MAALARSNPPQNARLSKDVLLRTSACARPLRQGCPITGRAGSCYEKRDSALFSAVGLTCLYLSAQRWPSVQAYRIGKTPHTEQQDSISHMRCKPPCKRFDAPPCNNNTNSHAASRTAVIQRALISLTGTYEFPQYSLRMESSACCDPVRKMGKRPSG